MLFSRTPIYCAALAAAALSAGSAMATVITYTPAAVAGGSWAAALTGPPAYAEADPFYSQDLANPTLNVDGYGQFIGWGSAVGINDATVTTMQYNGRAFDSLQNPTLNIAAPTGGTNASLLWLATNALGSGQFSSQQITVTLTDINGNQSTFNYLTSSTGPGLFGFTSDAAINTITVSALTGYDVDLMDFYAGTYADPVSPASECATLILAGGGLIVLGARRKFMRPTAC
jgi:hypothetical protein